jgi:hypothetical protein
MQKSSANASRLNPTTVHLKNYSQWSSRICPGMQGEKMVNKVGREGTSHHIKNPRVVSQQPVLYWMKKGEMVLRYGTKQVW